MAEKFVVFSESRSGSTLLQGLFNSHSHIHCEGEILTLTDGYKLNGKEVKYLTGKSLFTLCRYLPIPYIYIRRWLSEKPVYGCFLFIYHTPFISFAIQMLYALKWKIIYLEREDIINQSFSNIIALETRYFHSRGDSKNPEKLFFIPEDDFMRTVRSKIRWHDREKRCLEGINYTRVSYEDDLKDSGKRQKTMNSLFDLLSLEHEPVNAPTEKTYSKPYSEIVRNYDELMKCLEKNGYRELLDIHQKNN